MESKENFDQLSPQDQRLIAKYHHTNPLGDNPIFKRKKIKVPTWLKKFPTQKSILNHREQTIEYLLDYAVEHFDRASYAIGDAVTECKLSKPCGVPFCPFCRRGFQATTASAILNAFGGVPSKRLGFLTILLPITFDPRLGIADRIKECRKQIDNIFSYRGFTDVRMYGAFEVDVKHGSDLSIRRNTEKACEYLGMSKHDGSGFLVHLHAVIDYGSHSRDEVRKAFTSTYRGPYQVKLISLFRHKSTTENIETLAHYMLKFRTQYADNIHGHENHIRSTYHSFYPRDLLVDVVKGVCDVMASKGIASFMLKKNV